MASLDEELAARGLLNPVAVVNECESRLQLLQPEARAAFGVLCAQRLMDSHLRLPLADQIPFTLSWKPVIEQIWEGLNRDDDSGAKSIINDHLSAFYASPYWLSCDDDRPEGADENAAACSIFAAEAFCQGDAKSACWAAGRLIDSVDVNLNSAKHGGRNVVDEFADPLLQQEAQRLLKALQILETQRWSPAMIPKLRACFDLDDE